MDQKLDSIGERNEGLGKISIIRLPLDLCERKNDFGTMRLYKRSRVGLVILEYELDTLAYGVFFGPISVYITVSAAHF